MNNQHTEKQPSIVRSLIALRRHSVRLTTGMTERGATFSSVTQKLEVLAADARLASAFMPTATIIELLLSGVDDAPDERGLLYQLMQWANDGSARLCARRAQAALEWMRSERAAEERGAILSGCPDVMH